MKIFDAVWRIGLAYVGVCVAVNSFGAMNAAYAVSRGAPSDTDAWFWLFIGIVELIIAVVCVLPAWLRFRLSRSRSLSTTIKQQQHFAHSV
jgi:type VI protein secretion system component VasK